VYLWLARNQLSGPIPVELGNLSNLERLILLHNNLSRPISAELANLSSLVYLDLYGNPSLVCWQSEAALIWAQSVPYYIGPDAVYSFVYLPVVMSAVG
jgi:hypothetical protein